MNFQINLTKEEVGDLKNLFERYSEANLALCKAELVFEQAKADVESVFHRLQYDRDKE